MGIIYKPYTFATDDEISNKFANNDFNVLYEELNGGLDDSNVKAAALLDAAKLLNLSVTGDKLLSRVLADSNLDYTSVRVLRMGPTHPGQSGLNISSGLEPWEILIGNQIDTLVFIYAVNAENGNPRYLSPPKLTLGIELTSISGGNGLPTVRIDQSYATCAIVSVKFTANVITLDQTGFIHWQAFGGV